MILAYVGGVVLLVDLALVTLGVYAAMRFFCQRQVHKIGAKDQFSTEWTDRARAHPDYVAADEDDAVSWLEDAATGEIVKLSPAQLVRSGHDDPVRIERMGDIWRASLGRGEMAGTVLPAGDGYAVHVHAIPERER